MRTTDIVHLCLMLVALGLTYVLPLELLVLSYAVLGPAHYLTEISWLHDRKYFLPYRSIAVVLLISTAAALWSGSSYWFGFILWFSFVGCAVLSTGASLSEMTLAALICGGISGILWTFGVSFAIVGALLPTLVHVSLFTLVFMLLGAFRSGSKSQLLLVFSYCLAMAIIVFVPPSSATVLPELASLSRYYFGSVSVALGTLFGIENASFDSRIMSLLSFVYTYHYLNWFVKAEVIRWAKVPLPRLILIATLSAASTGLYLYDYVLGFQVLLSLSLLHVVLEFPLDSISIRDLASVLHRRVRRQPA